MYSAAEEALNGNFNENAGSLGFSEPLIKLTLCEGEHYEGEFTVSAPDDAMTEGTVISYDLRFDFPVREFSGSEAHIAYTFDTKGLIQGDDHRGEIRVISNRGEYLIPYEIHITPPKSKSPFDEIDSLFKFINHAKESFRGAALMFRSEAFTGLLKDGGNDYLSIYRALSGNTDDELFLEDFLLACKKKQPVKLSTPEEEIKLDYLSWENGRNVTVLKNGWGYSYFKVRTDCDFIALSKEYIDEDDFDNSTALLHFSVMEGMLHNGKNYGRIIFENRYGALPVTVCVYKKPVSRYLRDITRRIKHYTVDLMNYYEALRSHRISSHSWLSETEKIVLKLTELDPERLSFKLMNVQLLITGGRQNEAFYFLEQLRAAAEDTTDDAVYCYYYYLLTLLNRDDTDINNVSELVRDIFEKDRSNWRIAWLLFYLDDEYASSNEKRWELLKELSERGAYSPVMYAEGAQILIGNPTVLTRLGDFEIRLLSYMAKKDILSYEAADQFVYLLGRQRNSDMRTLPILKKAFSISPEDNILTAICTLYINNDIKNEEAFIWYERAVLRSLRITRLYEYYIMSMDMDASVEIPKSVLMYFSFDSSLSVLRNSFLYSYVYKNKAIYPEVYESYKQAMEEFVLKEAAAGVNNRFLATLYKEIINADNITPEAASGLRTGAFIYELIPKRQDIREIRVSYKKLSKDFPYPVRGSVSEDGGRLYVPIYSKEHTIALFSEDGRAAVSKEEYDIKRLMLPDRILELIGIYDEKEPNVLFDLWLSEKDKDDTQALMRLIMSDELYDNERLKITASLLDKYYEKDMLGELDSLLARLEIKDIGVPFIPRAVELLGKRGMNEKAYDFALECGFERIEGKLLLKLCSEMLNYKRSEDIELLSCAHVAYLKERVNAEVLSYLARYFKGTSAEMIKLFGTAKDYGCDVLPLSERILNQLLYTGENEDGASAVFTAYAERGTNIELKLAFISKLCHEYFVYEKELDRQYIKSLNLFIQSGADIPFVCKLAYTKFYSGYVRTLNPGESKAVMAFLKEMLHKDIYFKYFKEYANAFAFMHRFTDRTIVEYRLKEGKRAVINYMKNGSLQDERDYTREEFKNMYGGICVRQFVLFYGEKLSYYITEENENGDVLTETDTVYSNVPEEHDKNSKYTLINDIAIARNIGDDKALDELLHEYYKYEYLLRTVFNADD